MWGPRLIAKLVQITPITMVYCTYNELVFMGGINQLITGGFYIVPIYCIYRWKNHT